MKNFPLYKMHISICKSCPNIKEYKYEHKTEWFKSHRCILHDDNLAWIFNSHNGQIYELPSQCIYKKKHIVLDKLNKI